MVSRATAPSRGRLALVVGCLLIALSEAPLAFAQAPSPAPPAPPAGSSEETPPPFTEFGASVTFASAFVWRGFVLGEDPVAQPSAWVRVGPVTVTSWSNTYVPSAARMQYTEHDFSVDYSQDVRGVTLSFGWINYAFPRQDVGRYTNEFYAAVSAGGYLNPKVQVYHDVDEGDGTYAMVAVSHDYELPSTKITLSPTVSLGYNHHQWTDRRGFSDVTAQLNAEIPIPIPHLALQPFFGYSCGLDTAVFPRRFYGGITLTVE